jgi:hypothetical protein
LSNAICWDEDEAHIWNFQLHHSKSDLLLWIDSQLIKSYCGLMARQVFPLQLFGKYEDVFKNCLM